MSTSPHGATKTSAGSSGHPGGHGGSPIRGGAARRHGGRPTEKAQQFWPSLKRLLSELRPERRKLVMVALLALGGVSLDVAGPRLLGAATDVIFAGVVGSRLTPGQSKQDAIDQLRSQGENNLADLLSGIQVVPGQGIDVERLTTILLIALAAAVGSGVLMFLKAWLLNRVVQRSIFRLRRKVSEKLDRLPLSYFDKQPRGELLSRVTNDIDNIAQTLQQTLSQLLNSVLTVIGVTIMMLWVSWQLAIIALVMVPLTMLIASVIGKRSQKEFAAMWKSTGQVNAAVEESFTGQEIVKIFGHQPEVEKDFSTKNHAMYRASLKAQFLSGLISPVTVFIGNLSYIAVAVAGALRVASGSMPLGDVQAFIQYSRMFNHPIAQIASMANLLQSGVASSERVFEVLDAPEMSPDPDEQLPKPVRGSVDFDHVWFSYTPEQHLIEDLTLHVNPGQTVAIVGPTGAGKTTLVNLLMRFYDIDRGTIRVDDVDIATCSRNSLREQIGMVLQDTWLFEGTIAENIAYGKPGATHDEVVSAAQAAYVDKFTHSLPDGYDTQVEEGGANLSVGQRQLITIARAFIANPGMLILDEATSNVDTRTEVLVQHAMARLRSNRTSFVIAHRLSTIRDADVILVMKDGSIVETGTHPDLLERKGLYWQLYESQFTAAESDEA